MLSAIAGPRQVWPCSAMHARTASVTRNSTAVPRSPGSAKTAVGSSQITVGSVRPARSGTRVIDRYATREITVRASVVVSQIQMRVFLVRVMMPMSQDPRSDRPVTGWAGVACRDMPSTAVGSESGDDNGHITLPLVPTRLPCTGTTMSASGGGVGREYIDGSTAIVRGALDAGCTFFAGYPITPASSILMAMMRELPKVGGIAIQGEDEIASIGMWIGANLAGARAMTATSGPGISLYSENIGLAVMGEVPLVIVDVQRLGPSTGGATKNSEGDIQFVRWGTAGGYPLIVLAPSTITESYWLTARAFELAERFRCPVFLLTDKELATTLGTVESDSFPLVQPWTRQVGAQGAPYRYEPAADVAPLP